MEKEIRSWGKYIYLFFAYVISLMGDWLFRLTVPILIYQESQSPLEMSIAYSLSFLPYLLVTPLGGVWADRLNRRKMLIGGDVCAALVVLIVVVFSSISENYALVLYPSVFLLSSITAIYHPGLQSLIPLLVPESKLARANAFILTADNVLIFIGPAIAGGVLSFLGYKYALYLDMLSFLVSAALIWAIGTVIQPSVAIRTEEAKGKFKRMVHEISEGFLYVWRNNLIKAGAILFFWTNLATEIFFANMMFLLVGLLHLSPAQAGTVLAGTGLGSVIGSLLAPYFMSRMPPGRLIVLCTLLSGIALLPLAFVQNSTLVVISWGTVCAIEAAIPVAYFTLRQQVVPNAILGRVIATTRMISYAAIPIASILGGWLVAITGGITLVVLISVVLMFGSGIAAWFSVLGKSTQEIRTATG